MDLMDDHNGSLSSHQRFVSFNLYSINEPNHGSWSNVDNNSMYELGCAESGLMSG